MNLKRLLPIAALALLITGSLALTPSTPRARSNPRSFQVISAAELLSDLANRLDYLSRKAHRNERYQEAQIWRQWAELYRHGASQMTQVPAWFFVQHNVRWCSVNAYQMRSVGLGQLSNLFAASANLWHDIHEQLKEGNSLGDLSVTFPGEMLVVLPGAPGTPWEGMVYAQRPAPSRQQAPSMSLPGVCDRAEYQKCMSEVSNMQGRFSSQAAMRSTCQQWISGCN